MCQFKSGVILKNKVVLTPEGNESHSDLLESLGISDTHMNASKTFVRAELIPKNNDKMTDVRDWRYKVDQDIVSDWYEKDPERYEQDFRNAVEEYMNEWRKQFKFICGHYWTSVQDGDRTYFFMNGILKKSEFGKTNNYAESYVRDYLVNSELAAELKKEFGDKLLPISLDLTSMDGFKDYGSVDGDILAIFNIQMLMKFGENIPLIDSWYWLLILIRHRRETMPAVFGALAPMAVWTTAAAAGMTGACVRFSSFNLKSLDLAKNYRVAKKQARA